MVDLGVVTPNKVSIFLVKFYGKVHQEMWLKKFQKIYCAHKKIRKIRLRPPLYRALWQKHDPVNKK